MSVYITGDTHGDFRRFTTKRFPEQKEMTKDDFVIICGDFGGIWSTHPEYSPQEDYEFFIMTKRPFTFLFVDGNHENFDRLYSDEFEIVDFHGGKAHKIRDNVYHLMRGYVYELCGKKFFTFGGARSHDIQDGILDKKDFSSLKELYLVYDYKTHIEGQMLRINHISWWEQEMPSKEEMDFGKQTLKENDYKVDYIISHCPPREACTWCGFYDTDPLIDYFDKLIDSGLEFKSWWSGHLHVNQYNIVGKYNILYNEIHRIV